MNHESFLVPAGKKIRLKDYEPDFTGKYKSKEDATKKLEEDIRKLASLQDVLYAQDTYALLIVFQALDAAGKDGVIKHVMSGINPQGCQVVSFKAPSSEELDHDYLWRCTKVMPPRGHIGIFNRSYYEEVLVVRVHPEILKNQKLPAGAEHKDIWEHRYEQIRNLEHYLADNGTVILKFFLNVSQKEQKQRFLDRIDTPEKNWKFSPDDLKERAHWDEYMEAYQEAFNHTSTTCAPWYIIPADHKWFTRTAVADIIVRRLEGLHLSYPQVSEEQKQNLLKAKEILERE